MHFGSFFREEHAIVGRLTWENDADEEEEDTYGRSWKEEDDMVAAEGIWDTDVADTC